MLGALDIAAKSNACCVFELRLVDMLTNGL